ncbi:class I SAM-dependent methyltransferase [Pseudoalteromonas sp. NEC-BIFX-2020_015]|uniref:class I SAM-dependent methyltransferase n=1 Tax=Pseudoalteromonas sp. NEC-BIFX-2020_015 TaxID=2729544 RepID=UPI0014616911|nr:class I SAM-dependent methyltransferase [Pseudoalteromonas sp. NEC-BIFX-2020_015]NMR25270.1 class I SAM-dependent methyltransferase [Pseudoalteromonas sp. NEC-BIFX-2020_015]
MSHSFFWRKSMHWDHYWHLTETLSSFGDSKSTFGYPEEVLIFWEDIVCSKKKECAYLDLATGKGVLAILLQATMTQHNLIGSVAACDLAKIKKDKIKSDITAISNAIEKVEFKFNIALEMLPYKNDSLDVLVSQFGFEYSDWNKSLPEVLRVLKTEGEIILMMHHPDSVITSDCKLGLSILNTLLNENLFEELSEIIRVKFSGKVLLHERMNKALLNKIQNIEIKTENEEFWFMDVMSNISKIMMNLNNESLAELMNLKNSIHYQIERLEDQLSVAFCKFDVIKKLDLAGIGSRNFNIKEFYVNGELFSWVVRIYR